MHKSILLITVLLFTSSLFSQTELPDYLFDKPIETKDLGDRPYYNNVQVCSHGKHDHLQGKPEESQIAHRPYDVLKYDLFLDWYDIMDKNGPGKQLHTEYTGKISIEVVMDSANVNEIEIDAGSFEILNVRVNDFDLDEIPQVTDFLLNIPVEEGVGKTHTIVIDYKYNGSGRDGIYIYREGHATYDWWLQDTLYNHHNIAYTQSEPSDARLWFPCNDRPHDKAMYEISIRVPEGYAAPSNGVLEDIEENGDALIYHWKGTLPISTYLMVANASVYQLFEDEFQVNDDKTIPIMNYIWPEDGDKVDTLIIGNEAFKNTSQMLGYFSQLFRDYPYEKYGHAAAFPYGFGGMEHNTMTTVHRNWLRGYSEIGIAHEVVHHWIGDMITCATWNDLWINEGGASWGEALWQSQIGGENAYMNHMFNHYYRYHRSVERKEEYALEPMYGVPENELFSKGAVLNYPKAAWIYHMLYEWSGREPFISALQRLFEEFNFKAVESADFERIMKEELTDFPVPIENFFEDFVYSGGMPFIDISGIYSMNNDGDGYTVDVHIDQTQEGEKVPEVFDVFMEIVFFYENDNGEQETLYTDPFVFDQRSMTKTFELEVEPDSITVSRRRLLCLPVNSSIEKILSVSNQTQDNLKVYPSPVVSGNNLNIEYRTGNAVQSRFIITDAIGNVLHNTIKNTIYPGKHIIEIPTEKLSSGIYYGKLIVGKEIQTFSIPVIK